VHFTSVVNNSLVSGLQVQQRVERTQAASQTAKSVIGATALKDA
jgi:hypothetical protein